MYWLFIIVMLPSCPFWTVLTFIYCVLQKKKQVLIDIGMSKLLTFGRNIPLRTFSFREVFVFFLFNFFTFQGCTSITVSKIYKKSTNLNLFLREIHPLYEYVTIDLWNESKECPPNCFVKLSKWNTLVKVQSRLNWRRWAC